MWNRNWPVSRFVHRMTDSQDIAFISFKKFPVGSLMEFKWPRQGTTMARRAPPISMHFWRENRGKLGYVWFVMPCNDVTERLEVRLDSGDCLKWFSLRKNTCGAPVGNPLLLSFVAHKSAQEIIA